MKLWAKFSRQGLKPRHTIFGLLAVLVTFGVLSSTASAQPADPQAELAAAQQRWADRPSDSYVLSYTYFTSGTQLGGTTTVVDAVVLDPGAGTLTVQDFLAEIAGLLGSGASPSDLSFLPSGVPSAFAFNNNFYSLEAFRFFDPVESPKLAAAEALWDNRSSDDYTIAYRYCLGISGCQEQSLTFVDGRFTEGTDLNNGGDPFWTLSVDRLHRDLGSSLVDGAFVAEGNYNEFGVPTEYIIDLFDGGADDVTSFELISFDFTTSSVNELKTTVTCLAGNGRIDVNIVNDTDTAAVYSVRIGALSPRTSSVAPKSWWRSPVTGRADGLLDITVTRDGDVVLAETVNVACDNAATTSEPEVQFFTWCIGGNGMIFAQMANNTATNRAYVLDVEGIRRSTSAAGFGAAFRGISGRPNGTYNVEVITGVRVVSSATIEVNC